jgi:histidyl-tRNA synthetase
LFDYKIHIGHRRLLEAFIKTLGVPEEKLSSVIRAVDKAPKLSADELRAEVIRSGLDPASLPALDQFTALSGSLDGTLSKAMSLYGHAGLLRSSLDELRAIANALELYGVASKCILDLAIARGSDYYTGAIFECKYDTKLVGSIGGGGRYDNLIEVYGGPPTPAVGFSVGFERVMTLLNSLKLIDPKVLVPPTDVYIVIVDESCLEAGIKAAQSLRKSDWTVEVDLLHRKVKAQLSHASSLNARMSVIIGPDEIAANQITLRDMMSREEKLIDLDKLVNELSSALKALPQNY